MEVKTNQIPKKEHVKKKKDYDSKNKMTMSLFSLKAPMYLLFIGILLYPLGLIEVGIKGQFSIVNKSLNFQSTLQNNSEFFGIKHFYYQENEFVIQPFILNSSMEFDVNDPIYYQIVDLDNPSEILNEGYLSNDSITIPGEKMIGVESLYIAFFDIDSTEELSNATAFNYTLLDTSVAMNNINIINYLLGKDDLTTEKDFIRFLNYQYINEQTEQFFPSQMDDFIEQYIELPDRKKGEFITENFNDILENWNTKKEQFYLADVTDNEIEDFMKIRHPYQSFYPFNELITNYKNLNKYANEKAKSVVESKETALKNEGKDLTNYYEKRPNISDYERIKLLNEY